MDLTKKSKNPRSGTQFKKDKKLKKLIYKSDSDTEGSEHELSYYVNDRVKLMKEVLKIIKPKKIKSMAPECMKKLDVEEINSMLLEELLGISNKRLKYIFNGQNLEEDSSSTDPEVEQQAVDVISLDDVTDDEFVIDLDSETETKGKRFKKHKPKIKEEHRRKKIKKERQDKNGQKPSKKQGNDKMDEENLMSVLELLELQARARAIRSQLALENNKKTQDQEKIETRPEESDNDDAIIIESPKNIEIVISSSESENEDTNIQKKDKENNYSSNIVTNFKESISVSNTKENFLQDVSKNDEQNHEISETQNTSVETYFPQNSKNEESLSSNKVTDEAESEKKSSGPRSKITNIESIIISPPTNFVANISETKESVELNKGSQVLPTSEEETSDTKKEISKKVEESQSNVDEQEGIIINMEQYEIDCIISD